MCDIGIQLSFQGGESKGVTDSVLANMLGSVAIEVQYTAVRGQWFSLKMHGHVLIKDWKYFIYWQ